MAKHTSRSALMIIFVTVFIDLLGFGIVLPLLPRYAKTFEASGLVLGILMASFSAMQFLFAPIWGRLSDRVGRRPILILGLAGSAGFYTLFGYCTSLGAQGTLLGLGVVPWLFICRLGAGIAGATIPTAQAYIADVTGPEERARGMALIGAAFGIGFTFGPLLGAAFVPPDPTDFGSARSTVVRKLELTEQQRGAMSRHVEAYRAARRDLGRSSSRSQRDHLKQTRDQAILSELSPGQREAWAAINAPSPAPGYLAGVLSAVALASAVWLLPESLRPGCAAGPRHWFDVASLRQAAGRPQIALILSAMFLTTFAFGQFESTLSLLTEFLELGDRSNYYVFAYIGLVLAISQGVLVRRLLPRLGERAMAITGTVLMTAGLALVGVAGDRQSTAFLYAVLPVSVVGFSALTPSLQSLLSRRTDATQQGGMLGLGQSMAALARIAGPVVGLALNDRNVLWPYWAGAGLMALGVGMTARLARD